MEGSVASTRAYPERHVSNIEEVTGENLCLSQRITSTGERSNRRNSLTYVAAFIPGSARCRISGRGYLPALWSGSDKKAQKRKRERERGEEGRPNETSECGTALLSDAKRRSVAASGRVRIDRGCNPSSQDPRGSSSSAGEATLLLRINDVNRVRTERY